MTDEEVHQELVKCFEHDPETNNSELALRDRLLDIVRREGGQVFQPPQPQTWQVRGQTWQVWIQGIVCKSMVTVVHHPAEGAPGGCREGKDGRIN
jgi:hypothetical protein